VCLALVIYCLPGVGLIIFESANGGRLYAALLGAFAHEHNARALQVGKGIAYGLAQSAAGWLYVFARLHGAQLAIGCNKADAIFSYLKALLVIRVVELLQYLGYGFHATKLERMKGVG